MSPIKEKDLAASGLFLESHGTSIVGSSRAGFRNKISDWSVVINWDLQLLWATRLSTLTTLCSCVHELIGPVSFWRWRRAFAALPTRPARSAVLISSLLPAIFVTRPFFSYPLMDENQIPRDEDEDEELFLEWKNKLWCLEPWGLGCIGY